jgi:GH15 family glucan-1,4-alpha-glucosidase
VLECRQALAFPGDPHRTVLLRRLTAQGDPVPVRVRLAPPAGFDRHVMRELRQAPDGAWHARLDDLELRWTGAADAVAVDGGSALEIHLTISPDESLDLVLEISDAPLPRRAPEADAAWQATETAWRRQVPAMRETVAPTDAAQAYAVLRGLTASAGGMVAAATTSLPERAEEGRNYDYRYVWIRDQCYAAQAAAAVDDERLPDGAAAFVTARLLEDGPGLALAYRVDGRPIASPQQVDLPGYPGGYDQVGNGVAEQFQLDAFGESLLLLAVVAERLGPDGKRAAEVAVKAIAERRNEPDAGVWELAPRRWAHSRLTCAAGLRAIASCGVMGPNSDRCIELADLLVREADRECLHPTGRWQRSPDDPGGDGALLLPPLRGAVPGDDPRTVATLRAYLNDLTKDHFAFRYRHDEGPLGQAEGSFLLCGFVTALAEHQQGHDVEAMRWFERTRSAAGPAGLYAEEYDVTQREERGNLPQAFVHALMLECSARLNFPTGA